MLMTVEELKKYIKTDETDAVLEARLQALELNIRRYTNNNFQVIGIRRFADIVDGLFVMEALTPYKVGDTIQVSQSGASDGIYTVASAEHSEFTVKEPVRDGQNVLTTLVEYPVDVKLGAAKIIGWQLKNEAAASGDNSKKNIQSETLSRYSVTYATDASEADIDSDFGVPRKLTGFLSLYKKARF